MKQDASRQVGPSPVLVVERLRSVLATLMGYAGFTALVSRALVLARAEAPWLRAVSVGPDDAFEGLEEAEGRIDAAARSMGAIVLLAELLELLITFVGEDLTLNLVREVWPSLPLDRQILEKEP